MHQNNQPERHKDKKKKHHNDVNAKTWIKLGDIYDLRKMCQEKGFKLPDYNEEK